jgi:hypothetical protein
MFDGMENKNGTNIGFHLNWVSDDHTCISNSKNSTKVPFRVTLNAQCDASNTTKSTATMDWNTTDHC